MKIRETKFWDQYGLFVSLLIALTVVIVLFSPFWHLLQKINNMSFIYQTLIVAFWVIAAIFALIVLIVLGQLESFVQTIASLIVVAAVSYLAVIYPAIGYWCWGIVAALLIIALYWWWRTLV